MKKVKKITLIVIVSVIAIIFLVMFLTATLYSCTRTVDVLPTVFEILKPEDSKAPLINLEELKSLNLQQQKEKAIELYNKANALDQKTPYRMYYSTCLSNTINTLGEMKVDLYIHEFKNPSKYYRTDYRLPRNSLKGLNAIFEFQTAERTYYESSLEKARYEKTLEASYNKEKGPVGDWRSAKKKSIDVPYYNKNQPIEYKKSNHNITDETIVMAQTKVNDDGTISLLFILDTDNPDTTVRSRPAIIAGSKADDAHYTEITLEIILWDNGYFKEVITTETWKATVLGTSIINDFEYIDKYTYDKEICNIDKLAEVKELLYK